MPTSLLESPKNSRKPRVEHHPPYVGTFGPEAAEIMARSGKPLDPWQADAVDILCSFTADLKWACVEYCEMCPRQNGKGGILEARVLLGFLCLGERLILWSAHEYKTALEAFARLQELLFGLGRKINDYLVEIPTTGGVIPIKIVTTNGKEGFRRLDNGQRIKIVARSKGSGRGMSGDLVIIDEAYAYTPEQQEAQTPVILARPNPQIIYASTPPLTGDTGEVLYALQERATAGDETLGYRDWGLAGSLDELEKIDLDNRALWERANPSVPHRLTFGKIAVVKRAMRTSRGRGFARECLGVWPRKRKGVGTLDLSKWAKLADPNSRRSGDVCLAFDISPHREYAAIGLFGLRADGLGGHMQVLDYRPGTAWLIPRLNELRTALDPLVVVAGTASAKSMATELTNSGLLAPDDVGEPHRGCLWVASYTDISAATSRMLDIVAQGTARHQGQEALDDAVRVAKTRVSGDGVTWAKKDSTGDVTSLVSVTLAAWGFETIAPRVLMDYELLDSIG